MCLYKAVQWEMLACLWMSYLRVEPGKSCCSHSRFQWSEPLSTPADVLFSKAPDKALLSPIAFLPICGLQRLLLLLSFLISFTFHLLFLRQFLSGGSAVSDSLCNVRHHLGNLRVRSRGQHPAVPRRRWWGRFALIMLINSLDAVE